MVRGVRKIRGGERNKRVADVLIETLQVAGDIG